MYMYGRAERKVVPLVMEQHSDAEAGRRVRVCMRVLVYDLHTHIHMVLRPPV
jgi:hypothetical protein